MTCHEIEPYIVDVARGVTGGVPDEAEVAHHLIACPRCAELLEAERALSAALRGLAKASAQPLPDPAREAAILAAFDAVWARRSRHAPRRAWLPLAAGVLLAVGTSGLWMNVTRTSRPGRGTSPPLTGAPSQNRPETSPSETQQISVPSSAAAAVRPAGAKSFASGQGKRRRAGSYDGPRTQEFVPWPGAAALATFESGELVRLDLPASVLPSLGLLPPASQIGVVRADVLIGQDGFARAVRLVP